MALTKVKNSNLDDADLVALAGNDGSALTGVLKSADIGTTVQAFDATIMVDADIGTTVQAFDADLTTLATNGIGTSANQIVQLNGSAELPAVSGANLTNLPAGGATDINGLSDGYTDSSTILPSIGLGSGALANDDGSSNGNIGIGQFALNANTSGANNVAVSGYKGLYSNTTGNGNIALGNQALRDNTTGAENIGIGGFSLLENTTASNNVAIGSQTLKVNTTGHSNVVIGHDSSYSNTTGNENVAVGKNSLAANTTGYKHASVGAYSLYNNTASDSNTASGYKSMYANTTGSNNAAHGTLSFENNTTGSRNTGIGYSALPGNTSGGYNTGAGYRSLRTNTTGSYNTALGYNSQSSSPTVNGEFTLGDTNIGSLRCNQTSISSLSDQRDKTDVIESPYGLAFINTTQPRQFRWATRDGNVKDGTTRIGFIAQELLAACDGANNVLDLVMDNNPEKIEAKYGNLLPIAVQAIKELSAKNDALEARLLLLEALT
jgi:trimeric autotransporter adhesin